MQQCLQSAVKKREMKIEVLYQRLTQVTNPQETANLLQELEDLTGVKLVHSADVSGLANPFR